MPELMYDENGFTCECGMRNDYPAYVADHWNVRLHYSCPCRRHYILYRGKVQKVPQEALEYSDGEAFGD